MKAGDRRDRDGSGDPWSQPGMAAWALCWEQCSLMGSSIWHRRLKCLAFGLEAFGIVGSVEL